MKEKSQQIIIFLLVFQIFITFWGIWRITTSPERMIKNDCENLVSSFLDLNPNMSADVLQKISSDCHEQGGSKEWHQSKDMNQIRDEISDIAKRLGVN